MRFVATHDLCCKPQNANIAYEAAFMLGVNFNMDANDRGTSTQMAMQRWLVQSDVRRYRAFGVVALRWHLSVKKTSQPQNCVADVKFNRSQLPLLNQALLSKNDNASARCELNLFLNVNVSASKSLRGVTSVNTASPWGRRGSI